MGDIAEMIVNGEICQMCQVPFFDYNAGHPRTCDDCKRDEKRFSQKKRRKKKGNP